MEIEGGAYGTWAIVGAPRCGPVRKGEILACVHCLHHQWRAVVDMDVGAVVTESKIERVDMTPTSAGQHARCDLCGRAGFGIVLPGGQVGPPVF